MKAKYMFIVILGICRAQMTIVTLFSEQQSDKYSAVHQQTHSVVMMHKDNNVVVDKLEVPSCEALTILMH